MKVDLSAPAIEARVAQASALADLRPQRRLHAKLDMTAAGIVSRIQAASEMLDLCLALGRARHQAPTPKD